MTQSDTRTETWAPVPGAAFYQVSDLGNVRSVDRTLPDGRRRKGVPLRTRVSNRGYVLVDYTTDDGKGVTRTVHTIELEAFAGPCPPGMEALHGNDVPTDNRWPENLRWGTPAENMADRRRNNPAAPRICVRCETGVVTAGGRRCHDCVVEIGTAAAGLLRCGKTLAEACERLEYPSADGLHTLARKYGGYGQQPPRKPSRLQRVTASLATLRDRLRLGHHA